MMNQNYEDELRLITLTTMPQLLAGCVSPLCKNRQLDWFYKQVKDIMERDQKRRVLKDE